MPVCLYTYLQWVDYASNNPGLANLSPKDILEQFGVSVPPSLSPLTMCFIVDYRSGGYLHTDPKFKHLFGPDAGLDVFDLKTFLAKWHPEDFNIFNQKIFPEQVKMLQQVSYDYEHYIFSVNYRVKANNGKWLYLLRQSIFMELSADGYPLIELSFLTDITGYKNDAGIIHKIEKRADSENLVVGPLLMKTYHPDNKLPVLSKREIQILESIYRGMSSKAIAEQHYLSIYTINSHRKNMLQKTSTNNSHELIRFALENGLLHCRENTTTEGTGNAQNLVMQRN